MQRLICFSKKITFVISVEIVENFKNMKTASVLPRKIAGEIPKKISHESFSNIPKNEIF